MCRYKEMEYTEKRCDPIVLANDNYRGYDYYILSFGVYPCAYIDVSGLLDMALDSRDNIEHSINCHGRITYSSEKLIVTNETGWYIGWHYAHCTDYMGDIPFLEPITKHWTTLEMISECKRVIDQIVALTSTTTFVIKEDA